jgi:hypothetical protein
LTTVVLLVLAIVWGVLLVSWLRSRTEGTFNDSVGTFRRHLTVLERATPASGYSANRLRTGPMVGRTVRPSTVRTGYQGGPMARSVGAGLRPPSLAMRRRRQAQKRRRDVFFALLAGVVGTFLLAIIPGLSVMWSIQVLFDVLFAGYVALLIRMRNLAAERELKLTFMPQQSVGRPRPSYDFGTSGYGELSLRRAAN